MYIHYHQHHLDGSSVVVLCRDDADNIDDAEGMPTATRTTMMIIIYHERIKINDRDLVREDLASYYYVGYCCHGCRCHQGNEVDNVQNCLWLRYILRWDAFEFMLSVTP